MQQKQFGRHLALRPTRPDAVVIDIRLPDMGGFEVARRQRDALPGRSLVAVTC